MASAFALGANLTHVARRYDVTKAVIYRWRIERSRPLKGLAPVVVTDDPPAEAQPVERFIEILLGEESHIRIPLDSSPELVVSLIKAAADNNPDTGVAGDLDHCRATISILSAQLWYMLDGIDWRNPQYTFRPESSRAGKMEDEYRAVLDLRPR